MATNPSSQTPFHNEISLLDIIQFFKITYKKILFFIILGAILGIYYGTIDSQNYKAKILIQAPAVFNEKLIDQNNFKDLLIEGLIFSKETDLVCFSNQKKVFSSPSQTSLYLFVNIKNKEKEIYKCTQGMTNDINNYFKEQKNEIEIGYEKKLSKEIWKHNEYINLFNKLKKDHFYKEMDKETIRIIEEKIILIQENINEIQEKLNSEKKSEETVVSLVDLTKIDSTKKFFLLGTIFGGFIGLFLGLLKVIFSK